MDKEQQIRERAYHLWVEEGRPAGRHDEHWSRAAEIVANEAAPFKAETKAKRGAAALASPTAKKTQAAKKAPRNGKAS